MRLLTNVEMDDDISLIIIFNAIDNLLGPQIAISRSTYLVDLGVIGIGMDSIYIDNVISRYSGIGNTTIEVVHDALFLVIRVL